jgi:DNA invertase Pin-like site-specific DNA recombinase
MAEPGPAHLRRDAYIYVRQSTLAQTVRNTESLARQYDLAGRARELGWAEHQVVVVDDDLGRSGASAHGRKGFSDLVADVGLGKAGIVLSLECSRLARNNSDWYQLLDLCALTDTLIADADGLYHPGLFNDRLVLGLKGTMSEMLCRIPDKASYADFSVMPTRSCKHAASLAGVAGMSA